MKVICVLAPFCNRRECDHSKPHDVRELTVYSDYGNGNLIRSNCMLYPCSMGKVFFQTEAVCLEVEDEGQPPQERLEDTDSSTKT